MTQSEANQPSIRRPRRKWFGWSLIALTFLVLAVTIYIRTNPMVFNESFFGHAHCIPQAGLALRQYAGEHWGNFPLHTNGYGDALLLLLAGHYASSYALTGPGYDSRVFDFALLNHTDVPETECGRVFIQGLTEANNQGLAILFDKMPTPGGDYCHGWARIMAPLCREVLLVDGSHRTVQETKWKEFSQNQIGLLVKEGFDRAKAEALYAERGKVR